MRKILFIAKLCSLCCFLLLVLYSCRKHDVLPNENSPEYKKQITEQFFTVTGIVDPSVTKVINKLKQYPDYFPAFIKRNGFAKWDKAKVIATTQRLQRNGSFEMSVANAAGATNTYVALIPLVKETDKQVKNMLACTIVGDSITATVIKAANYQWYDTHASALGIDGLKLAVLFMKMDENVFGASKFNVKSSAGFKINGNPVTIINFNAGNETSSTNNSIESESISLSGGDPSAYEWKCDTIKIRVPPQGSAPEENPVPTNAGSAPGQQDVINSHAVPNYFVITYCNWTWLTAGTTNTGGGGDGTIGGGTGSGSGSGDPISDPCDDEGTPNPEPSPTTPGGDPALPCDSTDPPWVPEPPTTPVTIYTADIALEENIGPYEKAALFEGSRIYISPSGVPFELPVGAKVLVLTNIDTRIHPNGALYGIKLPNDEGRMDMYVSIQKEYVIADALTVPPPEFIKYHKVDPDTKVIDYNTTLDPNRLPRKQLTNNEPLRAVRIRIEKKPDGNCKAVRELVNYTPNEGVPTSLGVRDNMNDDVESLTKISGTVSEERDLEMCPGSSPQTNINMNLTQFLDKEGSMTVDFLKNQLQDNVKIYLYDCETNQVTHTITKNGVSSVSGADQTSLLNKFNNGNFTASDEDIAIKGCLGSDGKWNYQAKFNYTRLGNTHPKFANNVARAEAEIMRQVAEEVEILRKAGIRGADFIHIENGEVFYKAGMNLFQSLGAFLQLGKHLLKEGSLPEYIWNKDGLTNDPQNPIDTDLYHAYLKSPLKTAGIIGGSANQLIENATDVVQFVTMSMEALRHPGQTISGIYNGIKNLNRDKIKQFFNDATGISNYTTGGVRAQYQAGRHMVQGFSMLFAWSKVVVSGKDMVKQSGKEMTEVEKFIPDGSVNHPSALAIRNATENGLPVRRIDDNKILISNKINNQDRIVVVDRHGDIYDDVPTQNIDGVSDEVLKGANAGDVRDMHTDAAINNQVKTQPQPFLNGTAFEKNIDIDPTHPGKVQTASGENLTGFEKGEQVQILMPNGDYIVADNVWWKQVDDGAGGVKFEIVVNETKLSSNSPFTKNQEAFKNMVINGTTNFTLRTSKFERREFPKNAQLELKAYVNTIGNGTTGTTNYTVTKIP